jgi:hypothetical protein
LNTVRLALITSASLAVYLGLAIVGAGGPAQFFSHPPLLALTVITVALGAAALFTEGHLGSGLREDRSNRWVIGALGLLGFIDAYLPAYTDRYDILTFGGEGVRWFGVALFALGGVLRLARSSCSAAASAASSPSRPTIGSSQMGSTGSFAIRAISVSLSTPSAGGLRFARASAWRLRR